MKKLLCTFLILTGGTTAFAQTLEDDRLALIALYNSTNGPGWSRKTGWNVPGSPGDSPCGWFGVACSGNPARVTRLTPFENNLVGTVPAAISNLTALVTLDLSINKLSGSIPVEIGNMLSLKQLYLGFNNLTGTIPVQLGELVNLEEIDLSVNDLTGPIPNSFANFPHLKNLLLSHNSLRNYSFWPDYAHITDCYPIRK
jgi:hypothetical protein